MSNQTAYQFKFGEFSLDPSRRVLLKNNAPIPLTPKAFDTLLVLVRENGHVVEKEDLLKEIWPETFVSEATLAQNVFTLRKALGQKEGTNQFIETVPKHGYRFTADVTVIAEEPSQIILEKNTRTRIVSEETHEGDLVSEVHSQQIAQYKPAVNVSSVAGKRAPVFSLLGRKSTRQIATLTAIGIACCLFTIFVVKLSRSRLSSSSPVAFEQVKLRRLTNNGHIVLAALSPDNRYVAYATAEKKRQSLWLRQVDATTNVQIESPAEVFYRGITFAPDGLSILYVCYEGAEIIGKLYQMPVLGGPRKLIVSNIDSALSFSPDGKRFAFFRHDFQAQQAILVTANADGSDQQQLSTYHGFFTSDGPAWSPDGKEIAFSIFSAGDPNRNNSAVLIIRQLQDGVERPLTSRGWNAISGVGWLDPANIVLVGWDETTDALSAQVWKVSRQSGLAQRITNDLNTYTGVSVSSNGTLVTVQSDRVASFWLAETSDLENAKQITSGLGDKRGEALGLAWTSDNKIVYGSTAAGGIDIWTMDPDGRNRKQLTTDPLPDLKPTVSPLDRSIVFVSKRSGAPHLWTITDNGHNPRQLTNGKTESFPNMSPDGKWVAYISIEDKPTLWKLPVDGGQPRQLTDSFTWVPSISPDGKLIACLYKENANDPFQLALIPAEGGPAVKVFPLPPMVVAFAGVRWTVDGSSIVYINDEHDTSNLWSQPVKGGPPKQITHFESSQIFRFAWSPNGRQVLLERGATLRDVVLITDVIHSSS